MRAGSLQGESNSSFVNVNPSLKSLPACYGWAKREPEPQPLSHTSVKERFSLCGPHVLVCLLNLVSVLFIKYMGWFTKIVWRKDITYV